jgi:hypothetical protein
MVIIALILLVLSVAQITSSPQSISYPSNKVCISYINSEEIVIALKAVRKAYDFFSNIGYPNKYFLEIAFQKKLWLKAATRI